MNNANIPSSESINYFRKKIIKWFKTNGRSYPWRETDDVFKVLIAEMMLRRTKADQVKPVYEEFFKKFPNIEAVAGATIDEIKTVLYPLGMRWRDQSFHSVATEIKNKYDCVIPENRELLKELSGVGEYVAGAVLSIGYGKKEWIVDNNIARFFIRYFGMIIKGEARRNKLIIDIAKAYISCKTPRTANLAILDFTSLVCIPRKPLCKECMLRKKCKHDYLSNR